MDDESSLVVDERGGKWIGRLLIIDDVISNNDELGEHVSHIDDDDAADVVDDEVSKASANVRQIDFDDAIDGLIVFMCLCGCVCKRR